MAIEIEDTTAADVSSQIRHDINTEPESVIKIIFHVIRIL